MGDKHKEVKILSPNLTNASKLYDTTLVKQTQNGYLRAFSVSILAAAQSRRNQGNKTVSKQARTFERVRKRSAKQGTIHLLRVEIYSKKRLNSTLGYIPPVDFEAIHALRTVS